MGRSLPDHCCCCALRPGVFVICGFVFAICLSFLVILAMRSAELRYNVRPPGPRKEDIKNSYWMVVHMYGLNAALNGLEILMTLGLIWGICKKRERWLSRWLLVTSGWWMQNTIFALSIILSSANLQDLLLATFISPFLYYLGLQSIRTVGGLRAEMLREDGYGAGSSEHLAPATDEERAEVAGTAAASSSDDVQL